MSFLSHRSSLPFFSRPDLSARPAAGRSLLLLVIALLALSARAGAAEPGEWRLTGDTLIRTEEYRSLGDPTSVPYAITGRHTYQNLNFQLSQENSPYDRWLIEYAGLWNNSRYRSRFWGGETERFRLQREKGDAGLPYRLEAGDIYANFSTRTLQRSLKGLILDLQPRASGPRVKHSVQLLYGRSQPDWKYLHESTDRTAGVSWLLQDEKRFRAALSSVWNHRDADVTTGALERQQNVTSFAFERKLPAFGQGVLEGELARFHGDHDGSAGPASGQNRDDWARFLQLMGGVRDFQYRLRYECQGADFRPVGGSVPADRRSLEGFLTWNLQEGRTAVLRMQRFEDGWTTDNARLTHLSGLTLRGPLDVARRLIAGLNIFSEHLTDEKDTMRQSTKGFTADLNRTINDKMAARAGVTMRLTDNARNDAADHRLTQVTAGFDRSIELFTFAGRLAFDVGQRLIDQGGEESREWFPALGLSLNKKEHDLGFYYRFQRQDRPNPLRVDVDTADLTARYAWRKGDHQAGIDYLQVRRRDSNGVWSRGHQTAFWYQYAFDTIFGRRPVMVAAAPGTPVAGAGRPVDLWAGLSLGQPFAEALEQARGKLGPESRTWNRHIIFEATQLDEVAQRQRLVLTNEGDRLARLTLLIDADNATGFDVFERVRRILLERFGAPAETYEVGRPGPDLAAEVQLGQVVRAMEWRLPEGVLRLSLPRRLDGRLKIEVSLADTFPPLRATNWGLDLID
ncbi:MAG: hypothetical protein OZSIB_1056 [Candidatus Ozemobacter sibiricus]|jgi:hypothetical protein|uniref:Uncharacterized protein n=1 Tax=Candidatus Ozemobacter sibiricus TaxID=2268124 RepID=A0A367ZLD0_9BACT|nr:MAG: hypothetical protein OZSIB_1056 [Candidatus Ozemobacter sibiricus]